MKVYQTLVSRLLANCVKGDVFDYNCFQGCQQDNENVRALGVQDGVSYKFSAEDLVVSYTGGVGDRQMSLAYST